MAKPYIGQISYFINEKQQHKLLFWGYSDLKLYHFIIDINDIGLILPRYHRLRPCVLN